MSSGKFPVRRHPLASRVAICSMVNEIENAPHNNPEKRPDRLRALGHRQAHPRKPLVALDARGKLLIEYLVEGCRHAWISQYTRAAPTPDDPDRRVPIEPGQPLTLNEAADALRMRRRNVRWIASQPLFQRELAKALQQFRDGHKAEALRKVVDVMRDDGDGSAATKKVQLSAASMLLGDQVGPPAREPVTVNVGVQLSPGVVIRLPPGVARTPLEHEDAAPPVTIEHDDHHHEPRAIPRTERGNHE